MLAAEWIAGVSRAGGDGGVNRENREEDESEMRRKEG